MNKKNNNVMKVLRKMQQFLLATSLIFILGVCKKNTPELDKFFILNKGYYNLYANDTSLRAFRISASTTWKIISSCDWITLNQINGNSGVNEIEIYVKPNTLPQTRNCILEVFSAEVQERKTLSIRQLGTDPNILISTKKDFFNYNEIEYSDLEIISNTYWTVKTDSSAWLKFAFNSGKFSNVLPIRVDINLSQNPRSGTLVFEDIKKTISQGVVIKQLGVPPPSAFSIVTPENNSTFYKTFCKFSVNSAPLKFTPSIDPLGGNIYYTILLDKNPVPTKIFKDSVPSTNFDLDYFNDSISGTYNLQIIAQTPLKAISKSNIIKITINKGDFYSKISTVAGGNGEKNNVPGHPEYATSAPFSYTTASRNARNQLNFPSDFFIDSNLNIYVADQLNNRIQLWNKGSNTGITVAGGNGEGTNLNQIQPHSVAVNKNGILFVSDVYSNRIIKFPNGGNATTNGEILLQEDPDATGSFYGIFPHPNGSIFICNGIQNSIQKLSPPNFNTVDAIVVAGGNGKGSGLNQFNSPHNIFVDKNENMYIADEMNHRVMYWEKGATAGKVVAGGNGKGSELNQFNQPRSIIVDECLNMYIVDYMNKRIIRWVVGDTKGSLINGATLYQPHSMIYRPNGDIYVSDDNKNLIQKWQF